MGEIKGHMSNAKISTRELQQLKIISKVAGHKINSKKLVVLLCMNDKWGEKELRETTPFTIVMNSIKYLYVTLNTRKQVLNDRISKFLKKLKKVSEDGKMPMLLDQED